LPEGNRWLYEVKFDGFRALAIKMCGQVRSRSRNDKDFTRRYPGVAAPLAGLPDGTVIDGEVVASDAAGKQAFRLLAKRRHERALPRFDVLVLGGKDLTDESLIVRRDLFEHKVLRQLRVGATRDSRRSNGIVPRG
jgi:bifunctional non-homologous end joining protein LigD